MDLKHWERLETGAFQNRQTLQFVCVGDQGHAKLDAAWKAKQAEAARPPSPPTKPPKPNPAPVPKRGSDEGERE